MSLLLDALKKAEQAKRQKAAEKGAARQPGAELELEEIRGHGAVPEERADLSLEPMSSEPGRSSRPGPREGQDLPDGDIISFGPESAEEGEESAGRGSTQKPESESFADGVDTGSLDLEEFSRQLADAPGPGQPPGPEEHPGSKTDRFGASQTLPSLKNVQDSLREFYGESAKAAREAEAHGAKKESEATDTNVSRRAARNVFESKRPAARSGRGPWALVGIGAVVLAVLIVGGYYVGMSVVTVQPSRRPITPALPPVARTTPAPAEQAPMATGPAAASRVAAQPAPGQAPAAAGREPGAGGPQAPQRAMTPDEGYRLATTVASAAPPKPGPAPPATRPAQQPIQPAPVTHLPAEPKPVLAATEAATARGGAATAPPAQPQEPAIRIAHRAPVDRTYPRLQRAYSEFQAGRHEAARRIYQAVLANEPRNRDALLGLAAVAVSSGAMDQAYSYYDRVLSLNPKDPVALAALTSIQTSGDPLQSESRLKLLLEQDPGAPYLYFGLGNLYVAQSRWAEAQQAYFNAYRADSRNAGYALNLAVSLDHLAQSKAAAQYYRRALDLAQGRPVFDLEAVRLRLAALEGAGAAIQ